MTLRLELLALVVCGAAAAGVPATSYARRPTQDPYLLADATRLIAQERWDTLALYRTADGSLINRFSVPTPVSRFTASPDESRLLIGCEDGTFVLFRVDTGELLWQVRRPMPGIPDAWDMSFAGNGERFAVCNRDEQAVVFDTRTGEVIREIRFAQRPGIVDSVTLTPDGTGGYLVNRWQLYRFDLRADRVVEARLEAGKPVRFSADGKYVAFPVSREAGVEQLAFVSTEDPPTKRPLGKFGFIGRVRPMPDGSFLVTAEADRRPNHAWVGAQLWPDGRVNEVWRFGQLDRARVNERTDFLPGPMIGVTSHAGFVTTVTDLRTGRVVRKIDNSANWEAEDDRRRPLFPLWCTAAVVVAVVAAIGWVVWRRRRSRPGQPRPAT